MYDSQFWRIPAALVLGFLWCNGSIVSANSNIDKLYSTLLNANYNRNVRPVVNHSQTLDVHISFYITRFDVDEKGRQFDINLFVHQTWTDYRLKWDESEYEGLKVLHVPAEQIWRPDLVLYNNVEYGQKFNSYGSVNALVLSDGTVLYVPPAQFPATCQLDLRRWPFDQQSCFLKIGSWTYNAHQINLLLGENSTGLTQKDDAISVEYMTPHEAKTSPWKLISTAVSLQQKIYKCCPEPYPSADVLLTLERSSSLYRYTLILPSFMITLLTLATFFLPPSSSGKITIGLLDLLILCLYLIYFSVTLPPTGAEAPLIVIYFTTTAILVSCSVLLAVLTTNWVSFPRSSGPPALLLRALVALDGFPCSSCPLLPTAATLQPREAEAKPEKQWMCLSLAVDRLTFWCYCLVALFLMVQLHAA